MATKVSNFTEADALDGSELVPVIQGGANRKTTVQKIADKANAASIIDDAVPALDKAYSSEKTQELIDAESTRIDNLEASIPNPTGSRIIDGCRESWSGTGLTFDVTAGLYNIQGAPYSFAGDSKTLTAADATNGRFDVLALNTAEQLVVITGTPGANPDIPQVDPDSQLYLTAIYVAAGATTPTDIDLSLIYSENAEWVGAANGLTVDFADTASPFSATKDIKVSAGTNGGYLTLTADIAPDVTKYSLLKLYIKLIAALNNKSNIVASFYSGNKQVTNFVTLPVNKSLTGSYQNISIDLTQFQFTQSLFDTLRITFTGTTFSAFYLDYIQLQGVAGSTTVVNVQDATTTTKGIVKLAGDLAGTSEAPTVPGLATLQTQITALDANKLDAADYNDRFKGKYTTLAALQTAHPTANAGDYAQVDTGAGSDVVNYNYDVEDGWIEGGTGSGATNTDALPEGSTNLYFTTARAQAAISGTAGRISVTAGVIDIDAAYVGQNTITTVGTVATGVWQGTPIVSGYGGTGFSTYAKGDLIYASDVNTLAKLAATTDGYVLTLASGVPVWAAASGGSGGGWGLTGNAGTDGGATNFIGTTDAKAFVVKTNGTTAAIFTTSGTFELQSGVVGIGKPISGWLESYASAFIWCYGGFRPARDQSLMTLTNSSGVATLNVSGNIQLSGSITGVTTFSTTTSISTPVLRLNNTVSGVKLYYRDGGSSSSGVSLSSTGRTQFFNPIGQFGWYNESGFPANDTNMGMYYGFSTGLQVILGGVYIGGNAVPNASSILEIASTTKGVLLTRMTTTQRDTIATPAEGLIIYNTSTHKLNLYTGSAWEQVTSA